MARRAPKRSTASAPSADAPSADATQLHAERTVLERDLLTLLALTNESASRTEWTRLAKEAGLQLRGKTISSVDMKSFCARFEREGAVHVGRPTATLVYYSLHLSPTLRYLEEAASRGRLEPLLISVRRAHYFRFDDGPHYGWTDRHLNRYSTELRVAVALDNAEHAQKTAEIIDAEQLGMWLVASLGLDPQDTWLDLLGSHAATYLAELVQLANQHLFVLSARIAELAAREPAACPDLAHHLALRGCTAEAAELSLPKGEADIARLIGAFWTGDRDEAARLGDDAVASMSKKRKHRQLRGLGGLCHALARVALSHTNPAHWNALGKSLENPKKARTGYPLAYDALAAFHRCIRLGNEPGHVSFDNICGFYEGKWAEAPWPSVLSVSLTYVWLKQRDPRVREHVQFWAKRAEQGGFEGLAFEFDAVLGALDGRAPHEDSLAAAYQEREMWLVALDALEAVATGVVAERSASSAEPTRRFILWEVALGANQVDISPRLVSGPRAKRGKAASLAKMLDGKVKGLSEHDRRVLAAVDYVAIDPWSRRPKKRPELGTRALLALAEHPHVIRKDGTPLRITRGEPGLRVESDADGDELHVMIQPPRLWDASIAHQEQSHGHVIVYERTPEIERIAHALGRSTLRLPADARERLGKILGDLGSAVRISAAADIEIAGEEQPTDSRAVVLLHWNGSSLDARLRVTPLGLEGPHLSPARGGEVVAATIDGAPLRAKRDFDAERRNLDALLDACPILASLPEEHGEVQAADLYTAMEVLLELEQLGETIVIAWPRGQRLATPATRGAGDMRVAAREAGAWLTVDVQLPVDEQTVLGFRELLERRRGRFVELGEGRFVALTEDLQRRIDALEGLGKVQKKGLVASPIVLPIVEELARDAAKFTLDATARKRLDGIARAAKLKPRVPRGFKAELRDYQRTGFTWMARLAEAGLGACLADDMGLGKTVQTLALLLSRAKRGPALVVAPTSVASNWIDEANRFAPSLRVAGLANAADRGALVEGLGKRDVLVCSYGLLVTEAERLASVTFDTVVFDEAHLLKNARTKRSKAANELTAAFRISLTGTPIENHLGELWSLMQTTVPGMLGSEKHFEQRFAGPIGHGNRERSQQLRALLRPFLLRRTKAQVLDELPPRTEVTIRVAPNPSEHAFYEALRRRAIEQLEDTDGDPRGRLQILAQITRLRQAAVDPRLIDEDGPPGAKIDALLERLIALRAEGHRALVFSQFLGAMERVRTRLDEAGIAYLSLDGSTSAKERAKRIAAFQDGEADVFVMSLKAGGVGVNLTGADYVIHLDPWWNPAVEDQATSRSHRIGQLRPVTVYRLVTEGTIEEKILALHRNKRELAEDLLGQMDRAKKLDLEELRGLL